MLEEQSAFQEFEEVEEITISDEKELYSKIWTQPRECFKYIFKYIPEKYVFLLLAIGGAISGIERVIEIPLFDTADLLMYLMIGMVLGALFGWIPLCIHAFFLKVTGSWLKGTAETRHYRTAIAWGIIPLIPGVVLSFLLYAINGVDLIPETDGSAMDYIFWITLAVIALAPAVWSIVITIAGIAVVQKFPIWKATLNYFLPILILMTILLIFFGSTVIEQFL